MWAARVLGYRLTLLASRRRLLLRAVLGAVVAFVASVASVVKEPRPRKELTLLQLVNVRLADPVPDAFSPTSTGCGTALSHGFTPNSYNGDGAECSNAVIWLRTLWIPTWRRAGPRAAAFRHATSPRPLACLKPVTMPLASRALSRASARQTLHARRSMERPPAAAAF